MMFFLKFEICKHKYVSMRIASQNFERFLPPVLEKIAPKKTMIFCSIFRCTNHIKFGIFLKPSPFYIRSCRPFSDPAQINGDESPSGQLVIHIGRFYRHIFHDFANNSKLELLRIAVFNLPTTTISSKAEVADKW